MKSTAQLCIAKFGAPHGVRGALKLYAFTEDPLSVFDYLPLHDGRGNTYDPVFLHSNGTALVVSLKEITTREQAERLKDVELLVGRDMLPQPDDDEFYHEDLVGNTVISAAGDEIGVVLAMHNFGAGDIIEVKLAATSKTEMLPFTKAVVPAIDMQAGTVMVIMPEAIEAKADESR